MRRIAALLVALGLTLGLLGAGISASFTSTNTATATVSVGSFGIEINTVGGVQSTDHRSVTFTCPTIVSSVAASCQHDFIVTNVGTIPATVTVTQVGTPNPFPTGWAAYQLAGTPVIAGGGTLTFTGGMSWPELGTADLGRTVSITYTVSAAG